MALMELSELDVRGYPVVAVSGELTHVTAPDLRDLLHKHFKAARTVLLDMSAITFMDTSGLATLIEARNRADTQGGQVILCGLTERITEILTVTRVTQLFSIHANTGDAVLALEHEDD